MVTLTASRCPQNHPCPSIRVCPADALSQKGYGLPVVDESKCIDCGQCIAFCPRGAFSQAKAAAS